MTTPLGSWKARPLLNIDPDVVPFWEGLKKHQFLLHRCERCGTRYWPPTVCIRHPDIPRFEEMKWSPTSGRGKVFAYVVVHQVVDPAYADEIPYTLALVELEEGPLFPTRIVGCDWTQVKIGMPVEVKYEDVAEAGHTLPFFRPAQ